MRTDPGEVDVHGPPLVGWSLVVLCGLTGGYCLQRLRGTRGTGRQRAAAEALMGLGMAAMSLPVDAVSGNPWAPAVFAAVFTVAALHGLFLARAGELHLHHVLGCLAMVYMALAMPGGGAGHTGAGTGHPGGGGIPLLTGLLLAYFAVHVLRTGLRLAPDGPGTGSTTAPRTATAAATGRCEGPLPELTAVCRLSMGIGMFAMLLAL